MKKAALARNLANSLTLGTWTADALEAALVQRLPSPLHRLAKGIGAQLMEDFQSPYAPPPRHVAEALSTNDGFARILRYCQRKNVWPDPDLRAPVMTPISAFADLDIPQLPTSDALADWLFLSGARLSYLADLQGRHEEHGDMAVNHYHYLLKPKKSGGTRVLEAPKANLKAVQRQVLQGILDKVPVQADAFGFIKGRSCQDAARRHAGEEVVVSFDLKDFFPSVGAGRVYGLFRCLGYPHAVARLLTAVCTIATPARVLERLSFTDRTHYRQPHLPQGSPASPSLANQMVFGLDRRLSGLARRLEANFSRYADDLSFSGDRQILGVLLRAVPEIVRDEGFQVNAKKTRIMSQSSRQMVTGLVVNAHLNVRREDFDKLKAVIHGCGKPGDSRLENPQFRASLLGKIGWIEALNPARGQKLRRMLARAWDSRVAGPEGL